MDENAQQAAGPAETLRRNAATVSASSAESESVNQAPLTPGCSVAFWELSSCWLGGEHAGRTNDKNKSSGVTGFVFVLQRRSSLRRIDPVMRLQQLQQLIGGKTPELAAGAHTANNSDLTITAGNLSKLDSLLER